MNWLIGAVIVLAIFDIYAEIEIRKIKKHISRMRRLK